MFYLRAVYQKIYESATGSAEYKLANMLAIFVYISYQNSLNSTAIQHEEGIL